MTWKLKKRHEGIMLKLFGKSIITERNNMQSPEVGRNCGMPGTVSSDSWTSLTAIN